MMTGTPWNHAFMGPSTDCSGRRSARWSRVGSRSRDAWCTYWGSRALGEVRPVRRALLAVYDKTGLVALAKELADRRKPEHVEELKAQAIEPFDLVVVNLYPFRETVAGRAGGRGHREGRH